MQNKRLPLYVLIGAAVGVLIGLGSPAFAAFIAPIGSIYVRLMEVVVLPYIISSLILGLGQLKPENALRLARKSWTIYLALWGATFLVLVCAASTVPLVDQGVAVSFSDGPVNDASSQTSLVDLLVPNNLFQALSDNYLPSIVLAGLIFGVAVQSSEKPNALLNGLSVIRLACVRIWNWIIFVAPIGACALFASTISTMDPQGYAAMSIYIVVVTLSALLLGLWILPMMLSAFLPMRYGEILSALKDAFLIAIVTSLSVAALPMIQTAARKIAEKYSPSERAEQQKDVIEASLSISYPLAQIGNFFVMVFILYASYYYFVPMSGWRLVELPLVTLLSGFGSPTSSIGAVTFMADWLQMPPGTTNLYVEAMVITRYAQVLASVSGFAFVTIFVTFAFYGQIQFNARRFTLTAIVSLVCLGAIWSLGRWGGTHIQLQSETNYLVMGLPSELQAFSDENLASTLRSVSTDESRGSEDRASGASASDGRDDVDSGILDRIQSNGVLRVGVNPNVMPFAYENREGRIVGYDIEMMYRFAQSMNVKLDLVPYSWQSLADDLKQRRFDVAVGGIYVTDERLKTLTISNPYYENPLALIVHSDRVNDFASREDINDMENLTIAVFDDPVLLPQARRSFPSATIKVLKNYDDLSTQQDVDAAIWTFEQARSWAISHDGYSAVVPRDIASRFLFAYLMPPNAPGLSEYLNYWMGVQQENGVLSDMAKRWIDPAAKDTTVSPVRFP